MLKSLVIKNFRMLENFHVKKLGRINLIVGKNNSGKSTVLEALRIYAGNARIDVLQSIATVHDEKYRLKEEDEREKPESDLPFENFFTGRRFPENEVSIEIGEQDSKSLLKIEYGYFIEWRESVTDEVGETSLRIRRKRILSSELSTAEEAPVKALFVQKGENIMTLPFRNSSLRRVMSELPIAMPCSIIPTQYISMDELADEWDKIVLTENEATVKTALQIISPDLDAITFVRDEEPDRFNRRFSNRVAKVKLINHDRPVPFRSLGEGMLRVLQLILKTFPAQGGFLLIDEFENGLHYSVQEKVWGLIFDLAENLDIQVFATTHSWDCIESFAQVANEKKNIEGVLFNVGRSALNSNKGQAIATIFDEEQLFNITQADIEVR